MTVALHIEQRILNQDGAVQLRMLGERDAHQQAAVAAAANPQVLPAGDAVLDEPLRDRRKIVVDALPVLLQSGTVPLRSEFAAATNIGQHVNATPLEPRRTGVADLARRVGDLQSPLSA